jgi:hypothetical protein
MEWAMESFWNLTWNQMVIYRKNPNLTDTNEKKREKKYLLFQSVFLLCEKQTIILIFFKKKQVVTKQLGVLTTLP